MLLVVASLAGCAEGPGGPASAADAPLGPTSLRVGSSTIGEYLRLSSNVTGHTKRFAFEGGDFKETVEAYTDHRYFERSILGNATVRDAFLRPTASVMIETRATDLDPSDAALASFNATTARELATRRLVFTEHPNVHVMCFGGECQTTVERTRLYPRVADADEDPDWGSLEGRVLTLGRTLSFNRTFTFFTGPGQVSNVTHWLNFTPLRETQLDGERVFVVQPSSKFVQSGASSAKPMPTPSASRSAKPPPKSSHLLWVGARAPVPLKEELRLPFEHEGVWYWQNTTRHLDVFQPGSAAVPWGSGEAQPLVTRRPEAAVVVGKDFFSAKTAGLVHTLAKAWDAVQADPTLTNYQAHKLQHPGAAPFAGTYYPDAGNRAYTWRFWVDDGTNQIATVESRFQGVASNDVGVVQNRQPNSRVSCRCNQPTPDQLADAELVAVEDALKAGRTVWYTPGEPGAQYMLGMSANDGKLSGSLSLFNTRKQTFAPGPLAALSTVSLWRNTDSVSVSLRDGGILALNGTFALGVHEWPWLVSAGSPIVDVAEPDHGIPWWGLGPGPLRPFRETGDETQNG